MSGRAALFFEWEEYFTVAQWDQPGGGETAAANIGNPGELTISRYIRDAISVSEWACRHLHCPKLVVMGISWGTVLGLELAHRRPDLVAAYVGSGQGVSGPRGGTLGYPFALDDARQRGDQAGVAELQNAAPAPYAKFEEFLTRKKKRQSTGSETQ